MKKCRMCNHEIDHDAKICKQCGSDQRLFFRFIKVTGLANIVSIIVLILAVIQYYDAKNEKVMAQIANESAQIAQTKVDSLRNRIEILTKLNAEISYISTHRFEILASGAIIYPEIFSNKIDSLMQIIEPNRDKQEKWLEILNKSK